MKIDVHLNTYKQLTMMLEEGKSYDDVIQDLINLKIRAESNKSLVEQGIIYAGIIVPAGTIFLYKRNRGIVKDGALWFSDDLKFDSLIEATRYFVTKETNDPNRRQSAGMLWRINVPGQHRFVRFKEYLEQQPGYIPLRRNKFSKQED